MAKVIADSFQADNDDSRVFREMSDFIVLKKFCVLCSEESTCLKEMNKITDCHFF